MPTPNAHKTTPAAAAWCVLLLAGACAPGQAPETEEVVPVQTAAVQRAPIERIIEAQAILHPVDQASIMPKISAPVRAFHVNRGDHVRRGQLLAVLENRDLAAAAVEAKGTLDEAESNYRSTTAVSLPVDLAKAQTEVQSTKEALDAAKKLYDSRKSLLDEGALPRRQLDEASVAYIQARSQYEVAVQHLETLQKFGKEEQIKVAQALVEAARGRKEGADAQLEYTQITSPIDGVITDRPLYAGEMASLGAPLLTVMDIAHVIARANVPVEQLHFLKVGDPAAISALDSSEEIQGKVTVVSPALDPNSTTAEVWVLAPNPGERLKPGSSVHVAIRAETVQDAVVIPQVAILPAQDGTSMVLVVGSDSLAHEHKVVTGIRAGDRVQVLEGVTPGEQVITVGGFGLQDKTKVSIEKNEPHEPK
jgi:HlyD family secretion protein